MQLIINLVYLYYFYIHIFPCENSSSHNVIKENLQILESMDFVLIANDKTSSSASLKESVVKTAKFAVYATPIALPLNPFDQSDERDEDSQSMNIDAVYSCIFQSYPSSFALKASLEERRASSDPSMKASSMIYGELVDLLAMTRMFQAILQAGRWNLGILEDRNFRSLSFCDIGHGTGRVSIGAALFSIQQQYEKLDSKETFHIFQPCLGIELMDSLYDISKKIRENYNNEISSYQATANSNSTTNTVYPIVSFAHGSLLNLSILDWTQCDVVFANSTCFDEVLMEDIGELAQNMRPGSVVVTMSKVIPPSAGFEIIEELREKTSWGSADFYIQRKV